MGRRFREPRWQVFLRRVVPAVLLLTTLGTALAAGALYLGLSAWQAVPYAACLLLATGAHAFGHYIAARRSGVDAYFPYFVPDFGMWGTSGAYVKLTWPIENRQALLRIFAAGPLVGFGVSAAVLFIGVALSDVVPRPESEVLRFGDSLLILGLQRILFPSMTASDDLALHSIGLAGYYGLFFNAWHIFPVGRLDGGRMVYALFGYRPARVASWLTIVGLAILGGTWWGWWFFGLCAALTMIRLRSQHSLDRHERRLEPAMIIPACIMVVVLIITFVPVPLQMGP